VTQLSELNLISYTAIRYKLTAYNGRPLVQVFLFCVNCDSEQQVFAQLIIYSSLYSVMSTRSLMPIAKPKKSKNKTKTGKTETAALKVIILP